MQRILLFYKPIEECIERLQSSCLLDLNSRVLVKKIESSLTSDGSLLDIMPVINNFFSSLQGSLSKNFEGILLCVKIYSMISQSEGKFMMQRMLNEALTNLKVLAISLKQIEIEDLPTYQQNMLFEISFMSSVFFKNFDYHHESRRITRRVRKLCTRKVYSLFEFDFEADPFDNIFTIKNLIFRSHKVNS